MRSEKNIEDGINLVAFIKVCLKYKIPVIIATIIFGASSVFYSLSLNDIYESKAMVYVDNDRYIVGKSSVDSSSTLNNFMSGRSYNTYQNSTSLVLDYIQSRSFLLEFIENRKIKPDLMASISWDKASNKNIYNDLVYDPESDIWINRPNDEKVFRTISDLLIIKYGNASGLIEIGFKNINPYLSKKWTEWIIEDLNFVVSNQEIQQSKDVISILNSKDISSNLTQNYSVTKIIESHIENIMLASALKEYPLKTIDPAYIPDRKIQPRRSVICILGTFFGAMMTLYICLIRHFYFSNSNNEVD